MNEKEIKAYKSVSAPISIKDRILTEKENEKRYFGIKAVFSYSLAAVASLLVILSVIFWETSTELYFGNSLVDKDFVAVAELQNEKMVRTVSLEPAFTEIELELKADSKTEISVSEGYLKLDGKEKTKKITITKDTDFLWLLEFLPYGDEFELKVKTEKETLLYSVSLSKEGNTLFIKKIK